MDEIMNAMQSPEPASPVEDIRTLNDKLVAAKQQIVHLEKKIKELTEKSASQAEGTLDRSPEMYRRRRLALLHSQMYQDHHVPGDYGALRAEQMDQQLQTEVGPEEFVDLDDFLLHEGEGAPVVKGDQLTGARLNNSAQCDPDDVEADQGCVVCGRKLLSRGAANYKDDTCSNCEQKSGTNLDLRGITIPRALRSGEEQIHRMHEYSSDPFESFRSSTSNGQTSNSERCTFCDSVLAPGGGPSHMSSCPEYQRWSGAGSNDSFFYQPSSLYGTPYKGRRRRASPLLLDMEFLAN